MTENPYFDADWEHKYRERLATAERWQEVCDSIARQDGFGAPRHRAALAQMQEARANAEAALRGRHATLAQYAQARFAALDLSYEPDYAAFTTLEQVHAALRQAGLGEPVLVNEVSLPVGQPPGLAAFHPASAVIASARRFEAAELGVHQGLPAETYLDCIVSVHEQGERIHFCIAHRWGALSPRSGDQFRNIATVLARQAIAFSHPDAGSVFGAASASPDKRGLIRKINALAAKFRFYRHMLPRRELREQFGLVEMTWAGTRFIDPDFSATLFPSLPEALRAAAEAGGIGLAAPEGQLRALGSDHAWPQDEGRGAPGRPG